MRMPNSLRQGGFSLIEMVVAITVLGILSTSAALFLRGPITSYFDTEQRVDLADAGGLAMAKLSQDISRAVPDSAVVTPLGGGRYRLRFMLRLPAPALPQQITYICNPAQRTLRRNGILLANDIAGCLPPVLSASSGGQAQVVSLLLSFDNQGNRLNLAHTIRVEPLP
ncbi:MAG: prepilin-type N-terminal cleavage/methylation domain-containing protein [Deltaproteobacteria bacterium]|nr:prepilin-type N-terminal cleavage/methylation domain-containing protein [Thiobacillus sp.]MDP3219140.1 prepilin-type N-terminal cleavage/methylation domain-containing protein [Deltaproteobacteria bacterium]